MLALTERQAELLQHVERSIRERGYPPTFRELCEAMGLGNQHQAIADHLTALERKGYIRRDPKRARGIVPTKTRTDAVVAYLRAEADTREARRTNAGAIEAAVLREVAARMEGR